MSFGSFKDLASAAEKTGSLGAAVIEREAAQTGAEASAIRERMGETLAVMNAAIAEGLAGACRSRSGMVGGDAAKLAAAGDGPIGQPFTGALAAALATAEVNAAMGRIVAAPTGGASGVLPAVLLTIAERIGAEDDAIVDALFASAGIGGVIATRATLAGAAGGCQAEIGSAAAMAAGAAVEMAGGSPAQCGHAASLALQGLTGLVCDPVGGLVEVPCVARNATGTAVALAAIEMALAGIEFPIPFDQVVDAAAHVGRSLPPALRETALGGLAATEAGRALAREHGTEVKS